MTLKQRRISRGRTQVQAAREAGVSLRTWKRHEARGGPPDRAGEGWAKVLKWINSSPA